MIHKLSKSGMNVTEIANMSKEEVKGILEKNELSF